MGDVEIQMLRSLINQGFLGIQAKTRDLKWAKNYKDCHNVLDELILECQKTKALVDMKISDDECKSIKENYAKWLGEQDV